MAGGGDAVHSCGDFKYLSLSKSYLQDTDLQFLLMVLVT